MPIASASNWHLSFDGENCVKLRLERVDGDTSPGSGHAGHFVSYRYVWLRLFVSVSPNTWSKIDVVQLHAPKYKFLNDGNSWQDTSTPIRRNRKMVDRSRWQPRVGHGDGPENCGSMNDAADKNDHPLKGVDHETIRDVLNNYAHGATTEMCAETAGIDYDTAYQIIAYGIANQSLGFSVH